MELDQWVNYKRVDKIPINPKTLGNASTTNPDTWGTYEQACQNESDSLGIGFVITKESGIIGIDLDHCIDESGAVSDFAKEVVLLIDSYTEQSPSETGLHIWAYGEIPKSIKTDRIEIYDTGRYFTVTRRQLRRSPSDVMDRQFAISELYEKISPRSKRKQVEVVRAPVIADRIDQIKSALSDIPPDVPYSEWLEICMAIHSEFPTDIGIGLILDWSMDQFKEDNPYKVMSKKFDSFKRSTRVVTMGTLFFYAQSHRDSKG
jgi:hypothetical protein